MSRETINAEQIRDAQAGDTDAMWAIVQGCDAMLRGIVRSVAPGASVEDAEDYLQEARVVLIQHVRDYKSEASSAQLTSYVYRAARRAVAEAHISNSCAVAVPATATIVVRHLLWRHGGDVDKVWAELQEEKSATHRISREMFVAILEALAAVTSFDAPAANTATGEGRESLTLTDVIEDPSSEVTDSVERRDLALWLMTQIPQRQSFALRAFYGVDMTKQDDQQTCADMAVNGVALRRLRSRGVASARTVADAHGLTA
ncbi:RNA polymerase sigma factor (sigma-70 family) [Streptomyces sp. LBL]|uniref:sigma factor n=1 Tax=Streptomyces sp. LBL TaxID=2940562 RepID=UPI002474BDCF|nr:sigma factor [Streptomyces sp. LBL]MDH6625781.1 RNA polymerase sigma factor (sigma-70 family) [Streptomyces sp. LBL]